MVHKDHVFLIQKAIEKPAGIWADFGSGEGAFTLALRDAGGSEIQIYSIDTDGYRLRKQKTNFKNLFPDTKITYLQKDMTKELDLPPLDGILMANSLHYIKEQVEFIKQIKPLLKPTGKLVVVEYNVDVGNYWVPYPFSFETFKKMTGKAGYKNISLLEKISSQWLNEFYSAEAFV